MQTKIGVHFIEVDPEQAGQRLDNFLFSRYKDLPKSHLYRIIRKGELRINKKRCDPDQRLQAHDMIRMPPLMRDPVAQSAPKKVPISLGQELSGRVLYEDKYLLILNKPSGLAVHGGSGVKWGVIEALRQLKPQEKYLELVHRIDRETSGCLILAKKPTVLRECHALLRDGKMTKRYLFLAKGYWPAKLKLIDEALDKNHLQSGERIVKVTKEGKASRTLFSVKQRFAKATLMQAQLETGRTHQIRVHAAHAGFPIVGDDKYGDKAFNQFMQAYGCERLFLHAYRIEFDLQTLISQHIAVEAPLDNDLQKCLQRLATMKSSA